MGLASVAFAPTMSLGRDNLIPQLGEFLEDVAALMQSFMP